MQNNSTQRKIKHPYCVYVVQSNSTLKSNYSSRVKTKTKTPANHNESHKQKWSRPRKTCQFTINSEIKRLTSTMLMDIP